MFVLVRAVTYAALFIGFVLVYLPGRFLAWSGIVAPATTGASQVAGMIMVAIGTVIALWCVFTFVFIGKGTPAPFDPPRKLVIRGPYRFVRNPMYMGAGMTLAGAALFDDVSLQVNRGDLIKFQSRSIDSSKLCVYIFAIWVRQLLFVRQKS